MSSPKGTLLHLWPSGPLIYHQAFGTDPGLSEVHFTIQAVAEFSNDYSPQITLDRLLDVTGEDSVREAVESDRTLGGLADDVICDQAGGYEFSVGLDNVARLTTEWSVRVLVSS